MTRKVICLRCPRGCEVSTTLDEHGQIAEIHGNVCRLGEEYTRDEIKDPRRILCSTVRVKGGEYPLVPVWTSRAIPKDLLLDLARELRDIELTAPVHRDTVVIPDWRGTGADIICSADVARA